MKVLLVDDDEEILDAVTVGFHFEWRDCTVVTAKNGQEGLQLFFEHSPDIVLLDVTMPDLNGFDLLREIRRVSEVPVIILTARQTEANHVRGLDLGADDYVIKPFTILTLLARIRVILRRTGVQLNTSGARATTYGDLKIDMREQQVWVSGNQVQLTPSEFRLLYHLVRNPNRIIANRLLCERVWGSEWDATTNDLKALVHRLRTKLGDNPRHPRYIENQRGIGYRFVAPRNQGSVSTQG
jgi:two-component system, OmpR family, KDP operon response regulator KdpE